MIDILERKKRKYRQAYSINKRSVYLNDKKKDHLRHHTFTERWTTMIKAFLRETLRMQWFENKWRLNNLEKRLTTSRSFMAGYPRTLVIHCVWLRLGSYEVYDLGPVGITKGPAPPQGPPTVSAGPQHGFNRGRAGDQVEEGDRFTQVCSMRAILWTISGRLRRLTLYIWSRTWNSTEGLYMIPWALWGAGWVPGSLLSHGGPGRGAIWSWVCHVVWSNISN